MTGTRRFDGPSDLHLHSVHSDGTESPGLVMAAAHRHGLRTVALTDHDTTSGWAEAADAAVSLGMTFLPGMELSAKHQWRSVHVLAYLVDPDHPDLHAETSRIRSSRLDRARTMTDRISRDYDLTWDDIVAQTAGDATVGRPHIADALVARGHVRDRTEAFSSILSPRGDYYVALYAPDPVTAVQLVVGAGGVPIIAHPAGRAGVLPMPLLDRMLAAGLAGFELGHRENLADGIRTLRGMVAQRGSHRDRLERLPRPGQTERARREHHRRADGGAHRGARNGKSPRIRVENEGGVAPVSPGSST